VNEVARRNAMPSDLIEAKPGRRYASKPVPQCPIF
jgi:hypothetical protein